MFPSSLCSNNEACSEGESSMSVTAVTMNKYREFMVVIQQMKHVLLVNLLLIIIRLMKLKIENELDKGNIMFVTH